ncbi:MAG TPA: flagellar basal body rod protein FlgC [Synergistales bacterium]|nr:flagellar basal body rod protein FlgC [Synergistales bacterium]
MKVFRAIDTAGSALTAHRVLLDTIAENLANVNTTRTGEGGPYRRKIPVFSEIMKDASGGSGGVSVMEIAQDDSLLRVVHESGHPDADEDGCVAYPNVSVVREMADMVAASRAYEANLEVVESARAMWDAATELLRG